jgi:hypothetical protein
MYKGVKSTGYESTPKISYDDGMLDMKVPVARK